MQRFVLYATALVCLPSPAPAADAPVVVVVNEGTSGKSQVSGSVTLLSPDTFESVGQVELGLVPGDAVLSPDDKLLYVFAAEKGAGAKGSLAVVEIPSGRLVSMVDAGPEPEPLGFAEGRLFCLSRGAKDKKSIVTIVGGADQARQAVIEVPPGGFDGRVSADGKRLYVLHDAGGKDAAPTLSVVDSATKQVTSVPLVHAPSQMALSADGRWLYVLDRGDGKKKEAAVFVVDAPKGELAATLPAGLHPTRMRLHRSSGRVYLASRHASDENKGAVLGIEAAAVFAKVDLPERPYTLHLAPDGSAVRVELKDAIVELDPDLGKEQRRVSMDVSQPVSSDGRRRMIVLPQGPGMPASGLLQGLAVGLASALASATTVYAERSAALRDADGVAPFVFEAFARRHDGRFLYGLGVNQLAIWDAKTQATKMLDLAEGAYELVPAANGRLAFAKSIGELAVVDLYKNTILTRYPLSTGRKGRHYPRRELAPSEARRFGVIADGKQLSVISLRTGELLGTRKDLPSPMLALIPRSVEAIGEAAAAAAAAAVDRGLLHEADGEREPALAEYRKARTLAPGLWAPVERLFDIQFAAGRPDEAFAELEGWLGTSPSNPTECWRGAGRVMALKRHPVAVTLLQCALKNPADAGVPESNLHVHLARAYLAANDPGAARRHAEQAKKLGNVAAGAVLKEIDAKR